MMNRQFRKSKWDTPKTYAPIPPMYPPVITSLAPVSMTSVSSLEAASAAAAKINAVLAAKGKLQIHKSKDNDKSRTNQNELVIAEIEINDVPVYCRNMLTKRTMQDTISRETGAAVSTRGRYMSEEDKMSNTPGDRSLYLFVQALTMDKIDLAVNRIVDIIKGVSQNIDAYPKVTYKNVSNSAPGGNHHGGKFPQVGLPSVGTAFQEKVFIGLEHAHPSFNVKEKIEGPGLSFLNHIRMETGTPVYLRGKGSGLMERASGRESFENLYLFITHQKQENLLAAKKLCENLVQTIQAEYSKFQSQIMAGPQVPQIAVSSVGPSQILPNFNTAPPSLGVRPFLPSASQAAVVTVAAQTTPLVSTGVPPGHLATSQSMQPTSIQQVSVPASGGVVSVNNAVAYPHLQRFQVPGQQPTLFTSPVPVGIPGAVPRRVALLIQPSISPGVQQPHLTPGMVVAPRISAVVHPSGVIPQGIPVGMPPPVTLIPQRPPMVSEGIHQHLPHGVIATQAPGSEIRLSTSLQPFAAQSQPDPDKQVIQPTQITAVHLQPPPSLVEQVAPGQQPMPPSSAQQHLQGPPLQQTEPLLDAQPEIQAAPQLPERVHQQPPQLPSHIQLQQILQSHNHQQEAVAAAQQAAHQQAVHQQVIAQHAAAQQQAQQPQPAAPQQLILQQTPGLQTIPQSLPRSVPQSPEVQHQVVQGPPPSFFQTPPLGQPSPHPQPPQSQPPLLQGVTLRLPFGQGEPSILGQPPQQVPQSVAISLPQQLPVASVASSGDVSLAVTSMTPRILATISQIQNQQATSQAHLIQETVPQSLPVTSEGYTQGHQMSTHHTLPPASVGLLPLPTQLQIQPPSYSIAPTTLVVAAQGSIPGLLHRLDTAKEREALSTSRLLEARDRAFGRRRRFREDFELDENQPKSLRSSPEFERSSPYSARYQRRGEELFGRPRRFQEAGDSRSSFEVFSRERELRVSRFSDSSDRRLMPPPPLSRMTPANKTSLSPPRMQQPGRSEAIASMGQVRQCIFPEMVHQNHRNGNSKIMKNEANTIRI